MASKSAAFQIMVKPRGAICNLDCRYCYFLKKEQLYPGSDFRMADDVLEEFTRQYIAVQNVPEATFAWQGGEPTLMGIDFYRRAVEFQHKYRPARMQIHNAIQTNGVLLDEEWCHFFQQNHFLVGLSLDGPRPFHDAYRVDKGKQPTFDWVMAALSLLKKHQVEFNILTCVHAANAGHGLDVYRFLRDEVEAQYVQFIPIVERTNVHGFQQGSQVTSRSVTGGRYGEFLTAVFDEWLCNDVGSVFVQLFDVALGVWLGRRASLCIFNETCGHALALEHTGDLYSCDHFVEPDYLLGNIRQTHMLELVTSPQQSRFGQVKSTSLPKYCRECEVRFMCNGGCPKDRILKTPDGEPGLNFLCEGYRNFFNHIDPYMKMMAMLVRMQRPPAEIMQYADQLLPASGPRGTSHGARRTPITKRGERSRKSAGL